MTTQQSVQPAADHPATLLFVDDEKNILSSLRRLFRPKGYQILLAESGQAALELLEQHSVDVVISDMRMPAMTGDQFLRIVAQRWPSVQRILLTGYSEMQSTIAAINEGHIFAYFSKPWEEADLGLGIQNAIKQKRLIERDAHMTQELAKANAALKKVNLELDKRVKVRTKQLETALDKMHEHNKILRTNYMETVLGFSRLIAQHDGVIPGQARRIAEGMRKIAIAMACNEEDKQDYVFAGLLFQAGMISLPKKLLMKPIAFFDTADRRYYYQHAELGARTLEHLKPLRGAAQIIRQQYEHVDGSGVPKGLKELAVLPGAKALAVVRDYDFCQLGLMSGKPMVSSAAQSYLLRGCGKTYDPEIVNLFIKQIGQVKNKQHRPLVETSPMNLAPGMEVAEVICDNHVYLHDVILDESLIQEIMTLMENAGSVRVKVRAHALGS